MQDDDLVYEDPTPNDIRFLEDRLYEFNQAATGIDDGRTLGILVRDESGKVLAAAVGHTWGGTCELRQVWVAEAQRGAGLGRRLLAAAETEAIRRGCAQLVLATHSFQAPDFYQKFGYDVVSEVPEYPRGHSHLVMRKFLSGSS
jgi:ribosomal protein S18 acetylase RimI-like enzyme